MAIPNGGHAPLSPVLDGRRASRAARIAVLSVMLPRVLSAQSTLVSLAGSSPATLRTPPCRLTPKGRPEVRLIPERRSDLRRVSVGALGLSQALRARRIAVRRAYGESGATSLTRVSDIGTVRSDGDDVRCRGSETGPK